MPWMGCNVAFKVGRFKLTCSATCVRMRCRCHSSPSAYCQCKHTFFGTKQASSNGKPINDGHVIIVCRPGSKPGPKGHLGHPCHGAAAAGPGPSVEPACTVDTGTGVDTSSQRRAFSLPYSLEAPTCIAGLEQLQRCSSGSASVGREAADAGPSGGSACTSWGAQPGHQLPPKAPQPPVHHPEVGPRRWFLRPALAHDGDVLA